MQQPLALKINDASIGVGVIVVMATRQFYNSFYMFQKSVKMTSELPVLMTNCLIFFNVYKLHFRIPHISFNLV